MITFTRGSIDRQNSIRIAVLVNGRYATTIFAKRLPEPGMEIEAAGRKWRIEQVTATCWGTAAVDVGECT